MHNLITLLWRLREYLNSAVLGSVLVALICSSANGFAQVGLYDVFEFQTINSKTYSNSFDFQVIELQATFTSPSVILTTSLSIFLNSL